MCRVLFPLLAVAIAFAGEVRYASLKRTFPENAEKLFAEGAKLAKERYEKLVGEGNRQ